MIDSKAVDTQLKSLNLRFRLFGRSEIRELRRLLESGEKVLHCVYGYYQGGSGLLIATEKRVLLIDKRPFYLNIEDMTYDTLRHVDVILKSMQSSLNLHDGKKKLTFRSISDARLKNMKNYIADMIELSTKNQVVPIQLSEAARQYLKPAWRSRHNILLPRSGPKKFYRPTPIN